MKRRSSNVISSVKIRVQLQNLVNHLLGAHSGDHHEESRSHLHRSVDMEAGLKNLHTGLNLSLHQRCSDNSLRFIFRLFIQSSGHSDII